MRCVRIMLSGWARNKWTYNYVRLDCIEVFQTVFSRCCGFSSFTAVWKRFLGQCVWFSYYRYHSTGRAWSSGNNYLYFKFANKRSRYFCPLDCQEYNLAFKTSNMVRNIFFSTVVFTKEITPNYFLRDLFSRDISLLDFLLEFFRNYFGF